MEKEKSSLWKMGDVRPPVEIREMPAPKPWSWRNLLSYVGPGVIMGSMAVGGFETGTAPLAGSRGAYGFLWIVPIACFFSWIIQREIGRWTVATGESVLYGFARMKPGKFWAAFWPIANFINWGWPAWLGMGAVAAATLSGWGDPPTWVRIALIVMALIYTFGPRVYSVLEKVFYVIYIITVLLLLWAFFTEATPAAVVEVGGGFLGVRPSLFEIPWWIPGITAPVVFRSLNQPAGGTNNLWVSWWMREKGYGMGQYVGKVTGLAAKAEEVPTTGYMFDAKDKEQVSRFKTWMKYIDADALLFYFLIGGILMTFVFTVVSYTTLYYTEVSKGKIPITIAMAMGEALGPWAFTLFLFLIFIQLFDTQFGVYDATGRMFADWLRTDVPATRKRSYRTWYFLFLYVCVAFGIITAGLARPWAYWLAVGVIHLTTMAIYTPQILWINTKYLPEEIRPGTAIKILMVIMTIAYAAIAIYMTGYYLKWWIIPGTK
jgi:Mn2+/Fe2+ NRAMP family transporter